MADELDDDLLLDEQLVAHSDEETRQAPKSVEATSEDLAVDKKRKRRERQKAQRRKRAAEMHQLTEAEKSVVQQPAAIQADFLCAQQQQVFPKLSALEMQEIRVQDAMLLETYAFAPPRTQDHLAQFIGEYIATGAALDTKAPCMQQHGAPLALIITGNAQRAADLARAVRTLVPADGGDAEERAPKRQKRATGDAKPSAPRPTVAKLFARHFKLEAQDEWLRAQPTPIAVGTPHRVKQLVEREALLLDNVRGIVIDHSWTDAKKRTIFDTHETRNAVVDLLSERHILEALRWKEQQCRIALY